MSRPPTGGRPRHPFKRFACGAWHDRMSLHNLLLASPLTPAKEGVMPKLGIPATRMNRCKNRDLTFDMRRGARDAKRLWDVASMEWLGHALLRCHALRACIVSPCKDERDS